MITVKLTEKQIGSLLYAVGYQVELDPDGDGYDLEDEEQAERYAVLESAQLMLEKARTAARAKDAARKERSALAKTRRSLSARLFDDSKAARILQEEGWLDDRKEVPGTMRADS